MTSFQSRVCRNGWVIACVATVFSVSASGLLAAAPSSLVFNRDIRPVLSDNCLSCHGPDPGTRKGGLRLDTRDGLFAPTAKRGAVVVPGQPDKSPLWARIITTDPDDVMPPLKSHKELKPEQKQLLKEWIQQGAPWQSHWSLIKPERSTPPVPKLNAARVRNPIDAFIFAKLEEKGLSPAPEADRRTLARRLALDLTGLPPKPQDVEAFVKDRSPDFYEAYVDKLMTSERWGEHRGRYWLDVARYADTHGLHFDNYREMWPYRDWVIRAFNRNQPFDQFTLEQLAGDLLPKPTEDQKIATGFHRCNPTTNEGGTIEEENLTNYARDRVETTSWVWLGLTANCSVCHDHKFDPITMKDFYSMSAFFRNTTQTGFDGNVKESSPNLLLLQKEEDRVRWAALPGEIEKARKEVEPVRKGAESGFESWFATFRLDELDKSISSRSLSAHLPLKEHSNNEVEVVTPRGKSNVPSLGSLAFREGGKLGVAPKFATNTTVELKKVGDFERDQAFSVGGWFYVPGDFDGRGVLFSRMEEAPDLRGWDVVFEHGHFSAHLIHQWPDDAIRLRTKFRVARKGGWQHLMLTYDGSSRPEGVKLLVDGRPVELETDRVRDLRGSIRTKAPMTLARHYGADSLEGLSLQDFRVYSRALLPEEVRVLAEWGTLRDWVAKAPADRKPEPKQILMDYFLITQCQPFQAARTRVNQLERERDGFRFNHPVTHVQQEKSGSMGVAQILFRGQYDKPKEKVEPAVFAALNPFPPEAPKNRLGLAQWLISPENPLSARVTVNRFWQELYGVGLVKTSEDFGIMGETPVNQALLDWLAVEFREGGWDVKKLFRLLVTSSAYRQSSEATPEKLEKDPANRLISRGPRFRMDAEMVRDYALSVSGLLTSTIGGPSVRPYQPSGVWEAVAMPESNTRYYHSDTGEALYRRSLYTLWKRAAPPASMDVFNAPSRETSCLRRERTNTPLQALATLNDPQFIEAARHLAASALRESRRNPRKILNAMAERVLARPLEQEEIDLALKSSASFLEYYKAHPDQAEALLKVGASKSERGLSQPLLAAWTMTANQLLNLDEALNK